MTKSAIRVLPDPIVFAAPFMPPWQRPLSQETRHRLMAWLAELLPGVTVEIDEWEGADPRHPLHAVVVSFPDLARAPVVLPLIVDEIVRSDLVQALEQQ